MHAWYNQCNQISIDDMLILANVKTMIPILHLHEWSAMFSHVFIKSARSH